MAPGLRNFTVMSLGVETTAGTAVATTRQLYPDGTGMMSVDRMRTFHEGANRGLRSNIRHATQAGIGVQIPFRTADDVGVSFDELVIIGSQLDGGNTGTGGAADKTWTFTPTQATAGTFDTYTVEVGDDVQAWEVEYCFAQAFRLSASREGLTQAEIDFVGRQPTKTTATSTSSNSGVKIPGQLWTLKHATAQSGLTAASVQSNLLVGFDLAIDPGIRARWYQDGNLYYGQAISCERLSGTLNLKVEGTSTAVTQYYDKGAADTMDFVRLKATGPVLGGTFYSAQIDMAVFYEEVVPIAEEEDGVNIWNVSCRMAEDATWANSTVWTIVNSIAALP